MAASVVVEKGARFGRWTCTATTAGSRASVPCRCDCGNERTVASYSLRRGESRSCGCWADELAASRARIHGGYQTAEFRAWMAINRRCHSGHQPSNKPHFAKYGARGIRVCDRWRVSFENFLADMGPRPSQKHSIDRIDNSGHYEPQNCRWATASEQARNRRTNRWLLLNGERLVISEVAARLGVDCGSIRDWLRRGVADERGIKEASGSDATGGLA